MTNDEKRIAIAEACEWTECRERMDKTTDEISLSGLHPDNFGTGNAHQELPDYLNDLNAMHEAEKTLTEKQLDRYTDLLCDEVSEGQPDPNVHELITLTATQKANAFILSIA